MRILVLFIGIFVSLTFSFTGKCAANESGVITDIVSGIEEDSVVYAVKKMIIYNSKKPSKEEIENTVERVWLIRIFLYKGVQARPVIDIVLNGKMKHLEFEPVKAFDTESDALRYADGKEIRNVILLE